MRPLARHHRHHAGARDRRAVRDAAARRSRRARDQDRASRRRRFRARLRRARARPRLAFRLDQPLEGEPHARRQASGSAGDPEAPDRRGGRRRRAEPRARRRGAARPVVRGAGGGRSPAIIVCDISGYGDDGPYRDKKAYDLLIQSESGFLSVTGTEQEPSKAGLSIADIAAGMYAYTNILAALLHRQQTGRGQHIDISMLESLVEWMSYPLYYAIDGAAPPSRTGASHATIYPYGPFPAGDGKVVMLGLQNEREWARVLRQGAAAAGARARGALRDELEAQRRARRTARADRRRVRGADRRTGRRAPRRGADRQRARQHHARRVGASAAARARPLARGRHAGGRGAGAAAARLVGGGRAANGSGARAGRAHRRDPRRTRLLARAHRRAARREGRSSQEHSMPLDPITYLFVPGDRPERFDKAQASGADAVVLDLEDAVVPPAKAPARENIRAWVAAHRDATPHVVVRINDATSEWFAADLDFLRDGGVDHVMLPKAEAPEQVAAVVAVLGPRRPGAADHRDRTRHRERRAGRCRARRAATRLRHARLRRSTSTCRATSAVLSILRPGWPSRRAARASRRRSRASRRPSTTTPGCMADLAFARAFGFGAKLCIHPRQVARDQGRDAPVRCRARVGAQGGGRLRMLPTARRARCGSTGRWSIARSSSRRARCSTVGAEHCGDRRGGGTNRQATARRRTSTVPRSSV